MTRRAISLLPMLLLLGCQTRPAGISDADAAAIREITSRYNTTALAADWDGWANQLTEDAVFLQPNGPALQGRAAIRQWATGFTGMASFTSPVLEVGGAGPVAYARGTYAFAMGPTAQLQISDSGNWLTVYERQADGTWRIKRNIWNSSQPIAQARVMISPGQRAAGQDRSADERAIRELIQATGAALNARDWTAAAAVFAEGGDVILPGSPRVSGREAIRAFWQQRWSAAPKQRRITLTVRSLRFLDSEAAVADCTAEFSAGEPARDRATYVIVRRGGVWQVAALRVMQTEASQP